MKTNASIRIIRNASKKRTVIKNVHGFIAGSHYAKRAKHVEVSTATYLPIKHADEMSAIAMADRLTSIHIEVLKKLAK